ncbi:hypothetical protein fugu_005104 [Takifugu bimaculatus]|uniref:CARD domain-containing protein n=1 Tax=Takifugu bimaculatus TaxID=433685 RepID=A0A4Z2BCL7_9TELE|nr:hypothetical protein fugu_005104 [Takifugu bimaculatus]
MGDDFREQLIEDSAFLKADWRLDTELVDKLILQLNRIYPQILTDKEATKFRNLDVPTSVRMGELLTHLQGKGEEACKEFYRALHLACPVFFMGCFSIAVGMALLYYYSEDKLTGGSRALGIAALGLKRKAEEVLIWYTEESLMK